MSISKYSKFLSVFYQEFQQIDDLYDSAIEEEQMISMDTKSIIFFRGTEISIYYCFYPLAF